MGQARCSTLWIPCQLYLLPAGPRLPMGGALLQPPSSAPPSPCCSKWVWGRAAPAPRGACGKCTHSPDLPARSLRFSKMAGALSPVPDTLPSGDHFRTPLWLLVLRTEPRGLGLAVLCLHHHLTLRSFQLHLPHSPRPCCIYPSTPQLCTCPSLLAMPAPAFSLWGIIGISEQAAPEKPPP